MVIVLNVLLIHLIQLGPNSTWLVTSCPDMIWHVRRV